MWHLENENLISNNQCGFRPLRSCIDQLARLENYIQNAFINKEYVIAIFFDLEKAYDTTWRNSIVKQLNEWGIKGHLAIFIHKFLTD